jgi:hypothetical protein
MQYFKHMSNMRHDNKIKRLLSKYGLEGYGLYCLITESITEKLCSESPIPDLEETCDDIASFYNANSAKVDEMVHFMINQGLLEVNEISGRVTCLKIFKFLEASQTRSDAIRSLIKNYKDIKELTDNVSQTVTDIYERKEQKRTRKEQTKTVFSDAQNVLLSAEEYSTAKEKYGEQNLLTAINKLSAYKMANGRKYASDYGALNQWVWEAIKAVPLDQNKTATKKETCPDCGSMKYPSQDICPECHYDFINGGKFVRTDIEPGSLLSGIKLDIFNLT